jgi:hypothetical protein
VDAVIGVWRLAVRTVEFVRRIRHIAVRRPLVRLTGPPPAQGLVGVVETAADNRKALASSVVEPTLGLRPPQPVLLGDEPLDLIQDRLLVHESSIAP